ncbi:signal peptidase II [Candidatus Peregrinibacteria bacterium CG08_land_8_20_14_0_20_41_10]|nr:MAG: signal peptidase II [Candidatus Peregrinibacteria bacterium CG08_land_8_20_14_0_20_41_10]
MFLLISTSFLSLCLDQLTKFLVIQTPLLEKTRGHFLQIVYTQNTGIAFSLPLEGTILIIISILLLSLGLYLAVHYLNLRLKSTQILIGLVLGGSLGNLIDRFIKGSVTDFITLGNFPVFNLADIMITLGIFLLLLNYKKLSKQKD